MYQWLSLLIYVVICYKKITCAVSRPIRLNRKYWYIIILSDNVAPWYTSNTWADTCNTRIRGVLVCNWIKSLLEYYCKSLIFLQKWFVFCIADTQVNTAAMCMCEEYENLNYESNHKRIPSRSPTYLISPLKYFRPELFSFMLILMSYTTTV